MPRAIFICLIAATLCLGGAAFAEEKAEPYTVLPVQTKLLPKGAPEAAMFFWYGCGGCYSVARALAEKGEDWPKGAALIRMPALGNNIWAFHGQIYLALEAMKQPQKIHLDVFDAIQNGRLRVAERADLPKLISRLGIDGIDFMRAFDSPEVRARMDEINHASAAYNITMVPAMVIEGKYKFDLGTVDGPDGFIRLAEELIAKSGAE